MVLGRSCSDNGLLMSGVVEGEMGDGGGGWRGTRLYFVLLGRTSDSMS